MFDKAYYVNQYAFVRIKLREDIGKEIEDARTQTLDYSSRGESPNKNLG